MKFSILGGIIASFSILAGCGGGDGATNPPAVGPDTGQTGGVTIGGGTTGGGTSGGGTSGGGGGSSVFGFPQFKGLGSGIVMANDYPSLGQSLDGADSNDFSALSPSTLTTGSAVFDGVVIMSEPTNDVFGYIGNTTLNANFVTGTMTGSAGEFGYYRSKNNDPNSTEFPDFLRSVGGTLTLNGGAINPITFGTTTYSSMTGSLDGTLNNAGTNVVIDGNIGGIFVNENGVETFIAFGDSGFNSGSATIDSGAGTQALDLAVIAN